MYFLLVSIVLLFILIYSYLFLFIILFLFYSYLFLFILNLIILFIIRSRIIYYSHIFGSNFVFFLTTPHIPPGAGDCFMAGFLSRFITKKYTFEQCLLFGSASGALCVTKLGACDVLFSSKEVEEFGKLSG